MRAVRRKTAEHLSAAWATIPHVTQCDLADITGLEELRKKYAKQVEAAGGNLTVTSIAVKVVAAALRVFPQFNASIDMAADEIIVKKYVNIGVAVDTDRGLLVPVIRDADRKNIVQLSVELAQLSEKARTRKIALEEMQGGCFSISNLGGIGGTYFTPIVNAPEVAILGISRARMEPVYHKDGGFVPRFMLPLSLSYDHRVIDGADGIRFLRWVAEALEQPFLLALQGLIANRCTGPRDQEDTIREPRSSPTRPYPTTDRPIWPHMISVQLVVVGGGPGATPPRFWPPISGSASRSSIPK